MLRGGCWIERLEVCGKGRERGSVGSGCGWDGDGVLVSKVVKGFFGLFGLFEALEWG